MLKRFDHVSIAVDNIEEGYNVFVKRLGAKILREKTLSYDGAFSWTELMLGGVKIELIQPEGEGSFVTKFLEDSGSKMHHVTFEVDSIEEAVKNLESQGFRIVGRSDEDPEWKMAFIHPKSTYGVLIQIFEPKVKR
ncbi:MAG: VOC family protein [Thaumarchaeota archaeon]|nr:VOC family protein [Nitrososphaerota archaeon]